MLKKEPKIKLKKLKAMAMCIKGVSTGEKSRPLRLQVPSSSRDAGAEPATITAVFCRMKAGSIEQSNSIA
ncbi:MAG: hypothetical protein PHG12_06070 [Sphaerochaeta sp.]|nr:hypothetical protein [Sphaerochaeta sp.]